MTKVEEAAVSAQTIGSLLWARRADNRLALLAGDKRWTWAQTVAESARRAGLVSGQTPRDKPLHIGILLENCPDYVFWLGAAALSGATLVGLNPTHGDADLAAEAAHVDLEVIVTDAAGAARLRRIAPEGDEVAPGRSPQVWNIEDPTYVRALGAVAESAVLTEAAQQRATRLLLLFTSGTTGLAKAAICSQGRLADLAELNRNRFPVTADDVCYCPMPLFHGNALMALWAPALAAGASVALAPRFSASTFLDDVRRYDATFFTYVGRAVRYLLATQRHEDDHENLLTHGFGTEASPEDIREFGERFGCRLIEGYGSSEAGGLIQLSPDAPPTALGRPARPGVRVVDPESRRTCAVATLDAAGRLVNSDAAVGEIVDVDGAERFEGYYRNPAANAERVRHGWYWTGDLGFLDAAGFLYFAGRSGDWIRVDSENISALTVERVLRRHPQIVNAAVYAVPDPQSGDQVMAALELAEGVDFPDLDLPTFLSRQADLGSKGMPRLIRAGGPLPVTGSGKVRKATLQLEGWRTDTPVWTWQGRGTPNYVPLDALARERMRAEFARFGRLRFLPEALTSPQEEATNA